MSEINESLREELLVMRTEDLRVSTELAEFGALFEGYNSIMEAEKREREYLEWTRKVSWHK